MSSNKIREQSVLFNDCTLVVSQLFAASNRISKFIVHLNIFKLNYCFDLRWFRRFSDHPKTWELDNNVHSTNAECTKKFHGNYSHLWVVKGTVWKSSTEWNVVVITRVEVLNLMEKVINELKSWKEFKDLASVSTT